MAQHVIDKEDDTIICREPRTSLIVGIAAYFVVLMFCLDYRYGPIVVWNPSMDRGSLWNVLVGLLALWGLLYCLYRVLFPQAIFLANPSGVVVRYQRHAITVTWDQIVGIEVCQLPDWRFGLKQRTQNMIRLRLEAGVTVGGMGSQWICPGDRHSIDIEPALFEKPANDIVTRLITMKTTADQKQLE